MAGVGRRPRWEWRGDSGRGEGGEGRRGRAWDGGRGDAKDTGREAMEGVKWEGKGEGKVQARGRGGAKDRRRDAKEGAGREGTRATRPGWALHYYYAAIK